MFLLWGICIENKSHKQDITLFCHLNPLSRKIGLCRCHLHISTDLRALLYYLNSGIIDIKHHLLFSNVEIINASYQVLDYIPILTLHIHLMGARSRNLCRVDTLMIRELIIIVSTCALTLFFSGVLPSNLPLSSNSTILHDNSSESNGFAGRLYSVQDGDTVSKLKQEADIAYFIQIAESTAGHLPRLLKRLYHERNSYAIHFDSKMHSSLVKNITSSIFEENPEYEENVHIMEPELITYRGISMVLNTINAMSLLLKKDKKWDYFINLSGSDYPTVTAQLQRELLGKHRDNGFNFVVFTDKQKSNENFGYRMLKFHADEALAFRKQESEVIRTEFENPLAKMIEFEYVNAEAWMINSREFCDFVVTDGYARKLLVTFGYSVEASEHYFASLLWNHEKLNGTIVNRSMRHVIWEHEGQVAGQHPFYVDERREDGSFRFQSEVDTTAHFFMRKFKEANSELMDYIDERVNDKKHLEDVYSLYDWATNVAIEERKGKDRLKSKRMEGS